MICSTPPLIPSFCVEKIEKREVVGDELQDWLYYQATQSVCLFLLLLFAGPSQDVFLLPHIPWKGIVVVYY